MHRPPTPPGHEQPPHLRERDAAVSSLHLPFGRLVPKVALLWTLRHIWALGIQPVELSNGVRVERLVRNARCTEGDGATGGIFFCSQRLPTTNTRGWGDGRGRRDYTFDYTAPYCPTALTPNPIPLHPIRTLPYSHLLLLLSCYRILDVRFKPNAAGGIGREAAGGIGVRW